MIEQHCILFSKYVDTASHAIGDRASDYYGQYHQQRIDAKLYADQELSVIEYWQFLAYLHYVDASASFQEVVHNASHLWVADHLELAIEAECPGIIRRLEHGNNWWNYQPKSEDRESCSVWSSLLEDSDISTEVSMIDNIHYVAQRLREKMVATHKPF